MDLTEHLEDRIIEYFLRNTPDTQPTSWEVALWQSDPGDASLPVGSEVTGTGYARVAITFSVPSSGVTQNSANLVFPVAGGAWTTATHVAVFDNLGNFFLRGSISPSVTVASGQQLTIPAGNFELTVD